MDRINFLLQDNFPLSSEVMAKLEGMARMAGALAALCGSGNYIVSGCEDDGAGGNAPGMVVMNGEILPFAGGARLAYAEIVETSQTLSAFGVNYPEATKSRTVQFASTGTNLWANFKQGRTIDAIKQAVEAIRGEPIGTIQMFAGLVAPEGYRICDGSFVSKDDYPDLFALLQASNMTEENGNNFSLPDLRGRFVVGYKIDDVDYNANGKTGGEKTHTLTIPEMPNHCHAYTDDTNAEGHYGAIEPGFPARTQMGNFSQPTSGEDSGSGTVYDSQHVGGGQAHENRPPYMVLNYIIKVK